MGLAAEKQNSQFAALLYSAMANVHIGLLVLLFNFFFT